jgi:protein O-mannosyl-transferase
MSRGSKRKAHRPSATAARPAASEGKGIGQWPAFLALLLTTFIVYQRVWHAGFIWDDDAHVTRPDLSSLHGLHRMWTEPGATQQYYPILYSAFWLQSRLWGYSALGYHLTNVMVHVVVAWLLFRVLRYLSVPGAFLAASAFALHPVCVESVAWISEEKNTLSALFYMAAALAYFRFEEKRRPVWYVAGTLLFALALLSKTVTATLPAALLVVAWWRRGRVSWKSDVVPLLPWLAMGAFAGIVTSWVERTFVGVGTAGHQPGAIERLLVAGRALWFYAGKLFWPADLVFIYPRWTVDPRSLWQILFPVAAVGVLGVLFALRRRSRGALAAALLFAGTLSPALGFFDVYPFRFSYVADHFQYIAAAIMLSAASAGLVLATARLSPGLRRVARACAFCAVAALGSLAWLQTAMYTDVGTLWQATIARNPGCWMAYDNLGLALMGDGQLDEAIYQFGMALKINPGFAGTHNNLGVAYMSEGKMDVAIGQFQEAMKIEPGDLESHNNLGMALRREGRLDEAIAQYLRALEIKPGDLDANFNLGNALLQAGRTNEAVDQYRKAIAISPDSADAHNNLGNAFRRLGRMDEAIAEYRRALAIEPGNARAQGNLESAQAAGGR